MQVEMKNGLATIPSVVHNQPITSFCDPLLFGKLASDVEEITDQCFVGCFDFIDRVDVLVWDDQDVGWGDRMNIPKSRYPIILEYYLCWGLLADDFTKNAHQKVMPC